MPNKNKNQKKQQKKKTPPVKKKAGKSSPPMHKSMAYSMGVCNITNPFCEGSVGSRWPDDSYTKSVGWSTTNNPYDLLTDSNGNASRLIVADLGAPIANGTVAGVTATYTGSFGQLAAPPGNVARWRITSWGIRITSALTPMTASGMIRIRLNSPLLGASLASFNVTSPLADAVYDVPVSRVIGKDLFVIPAPLGTNARLFRDANRSMVINDWQNPGWQTINVAVTGGPASVNALVISTYVNYEFVFTDGDASTAFAQPPPANSPVLRNGSAGVVQKIGNFVEGTVQSIDRMYQSAAGRMLIGAGASYMFGPVGGTAAGMLMNGQRDVD